MTEGRSQETCEPSHERRRRYALQFLLVFGASISYLQMGMSLSWPNVLNSHLSVDNSTLFGSQLYLLEWHKDLINSLIYIGNIFGLFLAGCIVRKLGRQKSLSVAVLPGIIGWSMLCLAYNEYMLLCGRLCDGITCGMVTLTVITYATEIPDIAIRGNAAAVTTVMFLLGASFCVGIGIILAWYYVALLNVCMMLVSIFFIVPFLPESPTFLIVTKQEEKATKVLERLRGPYINVENEITQLKKMNDDVTEDNNWSFLLQKKVQKRILVLTVLFLLQAYSGTAVLRANTVRILHDSGVDLNEELLTTLLLLLPIAGSFVLWSLVDRYGRRVCLVISFMLMAVSYVVLGFKVYLQKNIIVSMVPLDLDNTELSPPYYTGQSTSEDYWWITVGGLMVCIFAMNIGIESLPWQLSSEYFPTTIRSQAMSVSVTIGALIGASALQLYSVMNSTLTTAGLFWMYAVVSGIGVVFTMLCVPETARKMVG